MVTDLRCSVWARERQVDPIGTAGSYSGFLLVEWPLPWPRDVSEIPELEALAPAARKAGVRVQAVIPDQESSQPRVMLYTWDAGKGAYSGAEAPAGPDAAETCLALLEGGSPTGTVAIQATDVLVCGHGRRDRCCGSLGTSLEMAVASSGILGPGVRVWRTSHTGGHRFAPTAVVLPEGTAWAYLDEETLRRVVAREGDFADLAGHYRGCTGLPGPAAQAVEREALRQVGWNLLDQPRRAENADEGVTRLVASDPSGATRSWEGRVVTTRLLAVPRCGEVVTDQDKTEPELAVEGLTGRVVTPV